MVNVKTQIEIDVLRHCLAIYAGGISIDGSSVLEKIYIH